MLNRSILLLDVVSEGQHGLSWLNAPLELFHTCVELLRSLKENIYYQVEIR